MVGPADGHAAIIRPLPFPGRRFQVSRPAPQLASTRMRLIVARCEVVYTGRLTAVLPEALRLVMVKSDGSVMVHADTGGFKPQNCGLPL